MKGRVIKSTGSWYLVHTDQGILSARLKGKFKQDELKLTNPIAVGDWVALEKEEGQESAPAGPSLETASLAGAVVGSARPASHWSG